MKHIWYLVLQLLKYTYHHILFRTERKEPPRDRIVVYIQGNVPPVVLLSHLNSACETDLLFIRKF